MEVRRPAGKPVGPEEARKGRRSRWGAVADMKVASAAAAVRTAAVQAEECRAGVVVCRPCAEW
jgi:hypothetical protein